MTTRPRLELVHSSDPVSQHPLDSPRDSLGAHDIARALAVACASGAEVGLLERRLLRQRRTGAVPRHGPPTCCAEAMRRRLEDQQPE